MEREEQDHGRRMQYVVLSRAHAGLYHEMVSLFAAWPDVAVVVDRRRRPRGAPQRAEERPAPAPAACDA
jgi:hypothetical protein